MKLGLGTIKYYLLRFFGRFHYIFTLVFALLIIVIGYWKFVIPSYYEVKNRENIDLTKVQKAEAELEAYLSNLKILRGKYDSFSSQQIKKLKEILPHDKDFPGLFVQAEDLADRNGMVLQSISISEDSENLEFQNSEGEQPVVEQGSIEVVKKLSVSLVVNGGTYEDLKKYLSDIEHNLRLFDVTSINFDSAFTGPYSINLTTYYLPENI